MDHLPGEILKNVAEYLPPLDAFQLNNTSKTLNSKLSLSLTAPRQILSSRIRHADNAWILHGPRQLEYGFKIPVPSQVSCHSILVSLSMENQSWIHATREGGYLVVMADEAMADDKESANKRGHIVFHSGSVPLSQEGLEILFKPKRDESYHLWYFGPSLDLSNVTIITLVFDDPSCSFTKASNFLAENKVFRSWNVKLSTSIFHHSLNAVLESAKYLLEKGDSLLPPIISFFCQHGLSEEDLSLKTLQSIESILVGLAHEISLFDKNMIDHTFPVEYDYIGDDDGNYLGDQILPDDGPPHEAPNLRRRLFNRFGAWRQRVPRLSRRP